MQLLLTIPTTLLAGALVVLVPGACILALLRLDRVVAPALVPAAALALGLLPLGALTALALGLHQPIEIVAAGLLLFVLASWVTLVRRDQRITRATANREDRARARGRGRAWVRPVRALVAGEWLRGTPLPALLLAAAGGVLAIVVGLYAWNDSLYHIGQAQKLLALSHPTFSNTLQFPDGSAHPGYLLPAWHEAIALTAFVARVDPVTAAWILPGLTYAVGILTAGGLAWVLTRARGAASVGAAAWLVIGVGTLPNTDAIANGMHPGSIALTVLMPLTIAMALTALWPDEPRRVAAGDVQPRVVTRAATFVAAVATLGMGVLHVGYLWVLAFGLLGYVVLWALRSPWPRTVVLRHLAVGGTIALVAATCLAVLLPGLNSQEGLGRSAAQELAANETSGQYEGENGANLDKVLRGDPDGAFHLRADYLVLAGGLALAGLLVVPLLLLAPRWPGGWYLVGSTTLVLGIALSDRVFPHFVKVVTLDQARRIERVLPLPSALAVGALAVGAACVALWTRRTTALRALAVALGAAAALGLVLLTDAVPPLAGYGGEQIVNPRVLTVVLGLLVLGIAVSSVLLWLRRPPLAGWTWPTALLGPAATTVATLLVLVGAAPTYARIGDVLQEGRMAMLPASMRTAEMRLFAPNVAKRLRALPPGSIVLADPRSRDGYIAMAAAPVYVVSSVPRHTALTPKNRVTERFDRAVSFFDGGFDDPGKLTAQERVQLLLDERVDAVVMNPRAARPVLGLLKSLPGVTQEGRGNNQVIYVIDRDVLAKSPEATGAPASPADRNEDAAAGS